MASRVDRARRRRHGHATYRLVRFADDFVIVVAGTQAQAEALKEEAAVVLSTMGLRLSQEKTRIVHVDRGFDFLGMRIRQAQKRGSGKTFIYTYPSAKAVAAIKGKVRSISKQGTNQPLSNLLRQLNAVLRGWTNYHRHGVSKATFGYLRHFTWRRVVCWLRSKHPRSNWRWLRRRYLPVGWWPREGEAVLFDPAAVGVTRYRFRGTSIPTPWGGATNEVTP